MDLPPEYLPREFTEADIKRLSGPAGRIIPNVLRRWNALEYGPALLAIDSATWSRMGPEWKGDLTADQLLRVSYLLGIYSDLYSVYGGAAGRSMAERWPTLPNTASLYSGRSPIEVMAEQGKPAMLETRLYLIDLLYV